MLNLFPYIKCVGISRDLINEWSSLNEMVLVNETRSQRILNEILKDFRKEMTYD